MSDHACRIELWFEFASTYSYVGIHAAEHAGIPLLHKPFLLGPIFAAQGWKDSPFNLYPAKGRYMWRDLSRLCDDAGLAFRMPSRFPRNGLLPARVATAAKDAAWMPEFCRRVYRANFAEDREISEPSVIDEILAELGEDGPSVRAEAATPRVKDALRRETERAIELGIFGAPTFVVGTELFWGADRLANAVRYLKTKG